MKLHLNAVGPCSRHAGCMVMCSPATARGHYYPHNSQAPALSIAQWTTLNACQSTRPVRPHSLLCGRVSVSAHAWLPQQATDDSRPRASSQRCSARKGNSTTDRRLWDNVDAVSPDEADATGGGAAAPAAEQDSMDAGEWSSYMQNYSGLGGSQYVEGLNDSYTDEQKFVLSPNGSEAWAGEANYDDRQAPDTGSGRIEEPPETLGSNDWAPVSSSSDWGDWDEDGTAWSTQSSYNGVDSRVDPLDQILGTSQRSETVRAALRDGPQPLADPVRAPRPRRGLDGEDESGEHEGGDGADDDGIPPIPSDITGLSRGDFEALLPLRPSMPQKRFYEPATLPERVVELLGSLGASMLLSKVCCDPAAALQNGPRDEGRLSVVHAAFMYTPASTLAHSKTPSCASCLSCQGALTCALGARRLSSWQRLRFCIPCGTRGCAPGCETWSCILASSLQSACGVRRSSKQRSLAGPVGPCQWAHFQGGAQAYGSWWETRNLEARVSLWSFHTNRVQSSSSQGSRQSCWC